MPSCDGCDIPMSRGRARKPDKLYQNIYDAYGMFHVTKYLVRDGERQMPCGSKDVKTRRIMEEIDALHNRRESSIGIRNFNVPYSLNKSKLWQRVAEAKENIADIQDSYNEIRCTVYSQNKDRLWWSNQPVSTEERLIEYHTIDENSDEVHRFTKPTSHVEFERPWMEKQQKKTEMRKKKKASKKFLITGKENSSMEPHTRLPFSHKPHILYREVNSEYSLSWANSQKRRPSKCYFETRGRKMRKANRREIWEYYHSGKGFIDIWSDAISGLYEEDLSYCDYDDDIFYDDEYASQFRNFYEDAEMCYFKRGPFCLDQNGDLFHSEEFQKIKHPKKQPPLAHEPDYVKWLQQAPSKTEDEPQDPTDFEEIPTGDHTLNCSSIPPLPTFTVQIPELRQFVNKRFFAQQRIQRLHPETYCMEVTKTNRNVMPIVIPSDFVGILCVQPVTESQSMRCTLNAGSSSLYKSALLNCFARYMNCQKMQDPLALEDREHSSQEGDQQSSLSEWDVQKCGICYAVDETCLSLSCRHYFCQQCWTSYIMQCLNESRVPIECPETCCHCVVDVCHMLPIVPLEICKYYENRLIQEAEQNPSWLQCSQCQTIVDLQNVAPEDSRLVRCLCKQVFCSSCKNEFHNPMDCRDATLYHSSSFEPGKTLNNPSVKILVKQCGICKAYFEPMKKCDPGLFSPRFRGEVKPLTCFCKGRICYRCCKPVLTERIPYTHYKHCVEKRQYVICEDVPIYKSESIPQSVLIQCQIFCQQRSILNLHAFKQYMDKLHIPLSTKDRYVATFLTISRLLECLCVKMYFMKEKLKGIGSDPRTRQGKLFSHATHMNLYVRLRFLMSRIEAAYTVNQPQEGRLSYLISALQKLMTDHKAVLGDGRVYDIH